MWCLEKTQTVFPKMVVNVVARLWLVCLFGSEGKPSEITLSVCASTRGCSGKGQLLNSAKYGKYISENGTSQTWLGVSGLWSN